MAEKLKAEGKQEVYKHEEMEELEDDEGNVYSYKVRFSSDAGFRFGTSLLTLSLVAQMYHDLKRQGLI